MKNLNDPSHWLSWIRACLIDPGNPINLPRPVSSHRGPKAMEKPTAVLGMLTGQDKRALLAIASCWHLYTCSDEDGRNGALEAVRALLPAMQSKCQCFGRELIAQQMDWDDRARLWAIVCPEGFRKPRLELVAPPMIGGAQISSRD
jgi:hypothetical protein